MNNKQMAEISAASVQAVHDVVKAQVAAGDRTGMTGARQCDVLAKALPEILDAYPAPEGQDADKWQRNVIRMFCGATAILNASQLRQDLEKAGVLDKSTSVAGRYKVEE